MGKRLYVDMDGTLAVFKPVDTLETLYEKDYFINLEPQQAVVDAVRKIIAEHPEIEVHIMSSVLSDSRYALQEKNAWLDKYLPEIDMEHRIFPPCGEDKKNYVRNGLTPEDYLLDDYSVNLNSWEPPARGIKILNGINATKGSWTSDRLRFDKAPEILADNIVSIVNEGAHIMDDVPGREKEIFLEELTHDISVSGFKATKTLVDNILKFSRLEGKNYTLKELVELNRSKPDFKDNPQKKECFEEIVKECREQELQKASFLKQEMVTEQIPAAGV